MFEIAKFKILLKKYEPIFSDILKDMDLEKIEDNKIIFKGKDNKEMKATVSDVVIHFDYISGDIKKYIIFPLPDKSLKTSDIKVIEMVKENRPNGSIIEKIEKVYGYSNFSDNELALIDLVSERYVFDKSIVFGKKWYTCDDVWDRWSFMKTTFESHMKTLVKPIDSVRWYVDSPYSSLTLLNGQDISYIYDIVDGIDKISRIYNLYNGVINEANSCDIFSIHLGLLGKRCFSYREVCRITDEENDICGCSKRKIYRGDNEFISNLIENRLGYKKEYDCSDLNSLLEAITYVKGASERTKEYLEKSMDVPYDEFSKLSFDEQQNLIRSHRSKKEKVKSKFLDIFKK